MTLPATGTISFSQVNTELGTAGGISLSASAVRTLFGKASGTISMSDGRGKSNYVGPDPYFDSTAINVYTDTPEGLASAGFSFNGNGALIKSGDVSDGATQYVATLATDVYKNFEFCLVNINSTAIISGSFTASVNSFSVYTMSNVKITNGSVGWTPLSRTTGNVLDVYMSSSYTGVTSEVTFTLQLRNKANVTRVVSIPCHIRSVY